MKLQCSCGAKYELEVTAAMAEAPVRFVCPACGVDASAFVNGLVRRELGLDTGSPGVPTANAAMAAPASSGSRPVVRLVTPTPPPPTAAAPAAAAGRPTPAAPICAKHPGQAAMEKCRVCGKPICPQCMRLFGYVCSPHCKAKAEASGIQVPVYAGMKARVEARQWRNIAAVGWTIGLLALGALGFWGWYAWVGSQPKVEFSVRFPEAAYSGQSALVGRDQLVFLHGGLLARYNLQTKSEVWSTQLIDGKEIDALVASRIKELRAEAERISQTDPDHTPRVPGPDRLKDRLERAAAAALQLRVVARNLWVGSPGRLSRYDWDTGKVLKEISAPGGLIPYGEELLAFDEAAPGNPKVTHIDLATGELRTESLRGAAPELAGGAGSSNSLPRTAPAGGRKTDLAGLPTGTPGRDAGKAMDPARIAQQAQHLSLPSRIALPVILANSRYQERALAEMTDATPSQLAPRAQAGPAEMVSLVPTKDGLVRFSVRLVDRKVVTRNAMKAAPAKSALDGNLTTGKTTELANEILNDMQRSRGGDTVEEDQSRYLAQVQPLDGGEGWSGELTGPPALFPLSTVNVVAAGKSLVVLGRAGAKRWEATLNYGLSAGSGAWSDETSVVGQGPCVEHKDGLYVFDQGVLTAFELATGKVRWSLPSVGIAGLFFDDRDMLYVNTTTAGLDAIRYSRQIDIGKNPSNVALKIDSRTGKILWSVHPGGLINYVSDQFVYTVHSFTPEEADPDGPAPVDTGFEPQAHLSIQRLDPGTGRKLWEHFEERAPLDVRFDKNTLHIVLKKEVEVLKFVAF